MELGTYILHLSAILFPSDPLPGTSLADIASKVRDGRIRRAAGLEILQTGDLGAHQAAKWSILSLESFLDGILCRWIQLYFGLKSRRAGESGTGNQYQSGFMHSRDCCRRRFSCTIFRHFIAFGAEFLEYRRVLNHAADPGDQWGRLEPLGISQLLKSQELSF